MLNVSQNALFWNLKVYSWNDNIHLRFLDKDFWQLNISHGRIIFVLNDSALKNPGIMKQVPYYIGWTRNATNNHAVCSMWQLYVKRYNFKTECDLQPYFASILGLQP